MDKERRISYIDAMRGFTMILVVYSHICHFCLGDSLIGYNRIFFLFRLPCFFFISGWLFEPVGRHPFKAVVRHKFMVQIVPTFIFLLLLAPPPEFFHQLGTLKGGYWFTFALFEFFLLYMVFERCCSRWSACVALAISVLSFCYAGSMNLWRQSASGFCWQSVALDVSGFLSVPLWRYYLFFYIGAMVRRYFARFIFLTDKWWIVLTITVGFFVIANTSHPASPVLEYLRFNVGGVLGMFMIFTLFRLLYSSHVLHRTIPADAPTRSLSRFSPLKYIGTRTLDVYLLHYFFLPRFLLPYGQQLVACDSRPLEFLVAMSLALIVLALSLLASYVIRLSPFLGHYLFGVKYADKH